MGNASQAQSKFMSNQQVKICPSETFWESSKVKDKQKRRDHIVFVFRVEKNPLTCGICLLYTISPRIKRNSRFIKQISHINLKKATFFMTNQNEKVIN